MSIPTSPAGPLYPVPLTAMLPPPAPSERDPSVSAHSSDSSSRKRKRSQRESIVPGTPSAFSSTGAFSATTKDKVLALLHGTGCWHCGARRIETCHVIGRKDIQFSWLQQSGIVPLEHLSDMENAIALCCLCHTEFDDQTNPGFIFMPTDIDYFIEFEKQDQRRRRRVRDETTILPSRAVPGPERYRQYQEGQGLLRSDAGPGGLYHAYILHDYFPRLGPPIQPGLSPFKQPKQWHGLPTAALRRAFLILGTLSTGVPRDIRRKLYKLQDLYLRDLSNAEENNRVDDSDEESPSDMPDLASSNSASDGGKKATQARQEPLLDNTAAIARLPSIPKRPIESTEAAASRPVSLPSKFMPLEQATHQVEKKNACELALAHGTYIWGPQSSSAEKMALLDDVQRAMQKTF